MNPAELMALRATMPWTQREIRPAGKRNEVVIQIVNKHGFEVPLLDMLKLVIHLSHKLAIAPAPTPPTPTTPNPEVPT